MKFKWEWLITVGLVAVIAACAVRVFNLGPFRYSSVCRRCGAVENTAEWQLLWTQIPIYKHSTVRQTAVSTSLLTNGIVGSHKHEWIFAQGGGNGIRCALGRAHRVIFTVESAKVGELFTALERYGERGFRDRVLAVVFDDRTTDYVHFLPVPEDGFNSATELHDWLSEHNPFTDDIVNPKSRQ